MSLIIRQYHADDIPAIRETYALSDHYMARTR